MSATTRQTTANGVEYDLTRPTWPVAVAAAYIDVSERHLRRQLEHGGDLEHLALRVGARVLVRVEALLAWVRGS